MKKNNRVYIRNIENILCPAIYKYFKYDDNGPLNNNLYVTVGIAEPLEENQFIILSQALYVVLIWTESRISGHPLLVISKGGKLYCNMSSSTEKLVIYKSLYNGYMPFALPINVFLSKVNHIAYPNIKQKYLFELLQY